MTKYSHLFRSSTGKGVARTWKGFMIGAIPFAVAAARMFDINLDGAILQEFEGAVTNAILALWTVFASFQMVMGVGRKIYYRIFSV